MFELLVVLRVVSLLLSCQVLACRAAQPNNSYCCSQVMWPPNYRPRPPHPQDNHPQQWQLDDDNKDKQTTGTKRTRWQNPGIVANGTDFQKFYSSLHDKSHVRTWNINFPYMYKSDQGPKFNILSGAMRAGNISTYYLPNWNYFKGSSTMRRLPLPQGVGHSIYLQSYNWQPSSRLEIGTGVWVRIFCQFFSQESCRRNIQWSSLRYIHPPHSHP